MMQYCDRPSQLLTGQEQWWQQQYVLLLVKYTKVHPDWKCFPISFGEEGEEMRIPTVPVWKWLLE